jgi:hypothetical protein
MASPTTEPQPDEHGLLHQLGEDLRDDLAAVRDAHADLRRAEGAAWAEYARKLEVLIDEMDHDLEAAKADLAAARATRKEHLTERLHAVTGRWHQALDELRVQESLAELDLRDAAGDRWTALRASVDRLRATVRRAQH